MSIIVYSLPDCPKCDELKDYLNEHNISFKTNNLEDPSTMVDLLYRGIDVSTAPLLEINHSIFTTREIFVNNNLNASLLGFSA